MHLKSGKRQISGNRNLEAIDQRESVGKFGRENASERSKLFGKSRKKSWKIGKKARKRFGKSRKRDGRDQKARENAGNPEQPGKSKRFGKTRETRNSRERARGLGKIRENPERAEKQKNFEKGSKSARIRTGNAPKRRKKPPQGGRFRQFSCKAEQ